jgi:hypothetical protein
MSLELKEVRNPVKRVRAERILAALLSSGDFAEYSAAGAISVEDGVALLRPRSAAMAMTLADSATGPGDCIRIEQLDEKDPTFTAVLTPATLDGGTTITFDGVGDYIVLQWVVTIGWTRKAGNAVIA